MRRTPHALLAIPLVLAIGLLGCGDDDDGGSPKRTSSDAFCDDAKAVDRQFDAIGAAVDPNGMPSVAKLKEQATSLDELADRAPGTIAGDIRTVASGVREIADALGDIDLDDQAAVNDPANAQRLQEMGAEMEKVGREVEAAGSRVAKFLEQRCGVSTGSTTTASTSSTVSTSTTTGATTTSGG